MNNFSTVKRRLKKKKIKRVKKKTEDREEDQNRKRIKQPQLLARRDYIGQPTNSTR